MTATFHIKASELNEAFLQKLHSLFSSDEIKIIVSEENDLDETEYLLGNPIERERLLKAMEDIKLGKNLTPFDPSQF